MVAAQKSRREMCLVAGRTVNGQAYVRGHRSDYTRWNEILRGNNDAISWDWPDVLQHFKRLEGNQKFNDDLHGSNGKLIVSDPGHIDDMARWFVQAVQAQGEPFNPDFNGVNQRGVGLFSVHLQSWPTDFCGLCLYRPAYEELQIFRCGCNRKCSASWSRVDGPSVSFTKTSRALSMKCVPMAR